MLCPSSCTNWIYSTAVIRIILCQWALPRRKLSAASHREGSRSILSHSIWDLWWTKPQLDWYSSPPKVFLFPLSVSFYWYSVLIFISTILLTEGKRRSLENFTHSNALLDIRQETGKFSGVFLVFKLLSGSVSLTANRYRVLLLKRTSSRQL
jgi:hypothetical protein